MRRKLLPAFLAGMLFAGCALAPARDEPPDPTARRAAGYALDMLGKPYRYGGTTPRGFDCSGLVQYSYGRAGLKVPRDTDGQRKLSRPVATHALAQGDLLFFNQDGRRSAHVAVYLGDDRFVHAPSSGKQVRKDSLTDPYWRKHLDEARRFPARPERTRADHRAL